MMRRTVAVLVVASLAAACGSNSVAPPEVRPVAVVPSAYEPAAQLDPSGKGLLNGGAVVGAAGGAGIGAMSAKASAGLLCTIGGPLCLIVMIPAAIVGGLVGGLAGGVVDAVTTDPGNRIANARGAIEQAVAEMRLTEALAAKTSAQANLPLKSAAQGEQFTLEVGVSELQILAQEKEMALVLRARSRLYRPSSGEVLDERTTQTQTEFRKYQDWAADEAQPLRQAVDAALVELSRSIVSELRSPRRAGTAIPPGG
jgi:hypothetical protein